MQLEKMEIQRENEKKPAFFCAVNWFHDDANHVSIIILNSVWRAL